MKPIVDKGSLNQIAEKYHLNAAINDKEFDQRFHQLCFEWVNRQAAYGKRVLELGYGEGNVTRQLLAAGKQVDIIEGAELLVNKARKIYGSSVNVHHALFSDFKPSQPYDVIVATNILEHVEDPIETLKCIRKWARSKTKIFVTVPNAESIHRRLAVLMGIQPKLDTLSPRDHLVGHRRVYSLDLLKEHVESCGFKIVAQQGFLMKVLPNSMMKDFQPGLIQAFYDISVQFDIRYLADIGVVLMTDT